MPRRWWEKLEKERYWLEATDRDDIGVDLHAPVMDSAGKENWRYTLFREAKSGDVVFHYDGKANAVVARSVIAGPPASQPIVWAARGTYARARNAQAKELPGYTIPLSETELLQHPISLDDIRAAKASLVDIVEGLRRKHHGLPLYFPFELSERPVRPMQGYAFKLPAGFVELFSLEPTSDSVELTITNDAELVGRSFAIWRDALLDGAIREHNFWRQPSERFVFTNQSDRRSTKLGKRTALGVDTIGEVWAVQINESDRPGDVNVATAIAVDQRGRSYLLRQGRLNPNTQSHEHILYDEFALLTGLRPANVLNGDTDIKRDWYVVTPLDDRGDTIRHNTALFVDACVMARTRGVGAGSVGDLGVLAPIYGNDETGGSYLVGPNATSETKEIQKHQGEVWQRMAALLRRAGAIVEKPRHAAGYEVDAEIVNGSRKILVEIKTTASATDVYSGLGQLMLYCKLLPRLAQHIPILLLPKRPRDPLANAIAECGVTICTFDMQQESQGLEIAFSREFLQWCGVDPAS